MDATIPGVNRAVALVYGVVGEGVSTTQKLRLGFVFPESGSGGSCFSVSLGGV